MEVFWREVRRGQRLVLVMGDDEHEEEIGGVRETKHGFDAFAKTFGYDPERARKGFATIEEAKAFVESFSPWELYNAQCVAVDSEVSPALDSASTEPLVNQTR